jgi:dGTP triphosphohydrolase
MTEAGDKVEAGLNKMMELWDKALYKLIDTVDAVNAGFKKARDAVIAVRDSLFDFRDKVQTAINEYKDKIQTAVNDGLSDARTKTQEALNAYRDKIQTSVNSGLADSRNKTQEALNAYRDKIQTSVNAGLSAVIPKLYEMVGMPIGQLMSPINIRNVTETSFEFYSLSSGLKLHYICIGKR